MTRWGLLLTSILRLQKINIHYYPPVLTVIQVWTLLQNATFIAIVCHSRCCFLLQERKQKFAYNAILCRTHNKFRNWFHFFRFEAIWTISSMFFYDEFCSKRFKFEKIKEIGRRSSMKRVQILRDDRTQQIHGKGTLLVLLIAWYLL